MDPIQGLIELLERNKKITQESQKIIHFCMDAPHEEKNSYIDLCDEIGCGNCPFHPDNLDQSIQLIKALQPYAKTLQIIDPKE